MIRKYRSLYENEEHKLNSIWKLSNGLYAWKTMRDLHGMGEDAVIFIFKHETDAIQAKTEGVNFSDDETPTVEKSAIDPSKWQGSNVEKERENLSFENAIRFASKFYSFED